MQYSEKRQALLQVDGYYFHSLIINFLLNKMSCNSLQLPYTNTQLKNEKLETSVNTATTSNNCFQAKPLLSNCHSSISIQQSDHKNEFRKQRKLFMKFLISKSKSIHQANILEQMVRIYQKSEGYVKWNQNQFEKNKMEISSSVLDKTLEYFCFIWMSQMGYKTQSNKKKVIQQVRMSISDDKIYKAIVFYENLGFGVLSYKEQLDLKLGICRNGWEYLSNQIILYWNRIEYYYQMEQKQKVRQSDGCSETISKKKCINIKQTGSGRRSNR